MSISRSSFEWGSVPRAACGGGEWRRRMPRATEDKKHACLHKFAIPSAGVLRQGVAGGGNCRQGIDWIDDSTRGRHWRPVAGITLDHGRYANFYIGFPRSVGCVPVGLRGAMGGVWVDRDGLRASCGGFRVTGVPRFTHPTKYRRGRCHERSVESGGKSSPRINSRKTPRNPMPKEAARAAGFGGPAHSSTPPPTSQKHAKHTTRPSDRQVSAAQLGVVAAWWRGESISPRESEGSRRRRQRG
ncbi:hypothetical protein D3C85_428530 [compost metagenome]